MTKRWKVCGLRDSENIQSVVDLQPDFVGFIFYAPSPRYAGGQLEVKTTSRIEQRIKKVGVFVNAAEEEILNLNNKFGLDYIQLHGSESVAFCAQLKNKDLKLIKAFPVDHQFNFKSTASYAQVTDLFLFDTKTPKFGGSGQSFNWTRLNEYNGSQPFLLGGGINPENALEALEIDHPKMIGIDVNSRFETKPGTKNLNMLLELQKTLKRLNNKASV